MNYRHAYHAGNFGDVLKHALLVALIKALQEKPKGFLYLDTHAGRGFYDLAATGRGDRLERNPEWPTGIGRLWNATDLPPPLADYVELVRSFDRQMGNLADEIRFYPGSPLLARMLARPSLDRLALCEKQPAECAALRDALSGSGGRGGLRPNPERPFDKSRGSARSATVRYTVHAIDGYEALRAMLPAPERRALVLVDPPYETVDEAEHVAAGIAGALRRAPGSTFAIWYPLTGRVRPETFFRKLIELKPPPTLAVELTIAGESSGIKMRGCALTILNPPWQFEAVARETVACLADALAQAPGGGGAVTWVVPES